MFCSILKLDKTQFLAYNVYYKTVTAATTFTPEMERIKSFFEQNFPLENAAEWDNVGHLIHSERQENEKVLLAIDLTESVLEEAIIKSISIIVVYHPVIFRGIKSINSFYSKIISNKINVFAFHTSTDKTMNSSFLSHLLEVEEENNIEFNEYTAFSENVQFDLQNILEKTKRLCSLEKIRVAYGKNHDQSTIPEKVFVGVGSGSFPDCKNSLIITGEMSHHSILHNVKNNNTVFLLEHCNSERWFLKNLKEKLEPFLKPIPVLISKEDKSSIIIK